MGWECVIKHHALPHWLIFHPDEREEPEGIFKWYLQGFKPSDDPSALIDTLQEEDNLIRILKTTGAGALIAS